MGETESFGEPNPENYLPVHYLYTTDKEEEKQAITLVKELWPSPNILPCETRLRDLWAGRGKGAARSKLRLVENDLKAWLYTQNKDRTPTWQVCRDYAITVLDRIEAKHTSATGYIGAVCCSFEQKRQENIIIAQSGCDSDALVADPARLGLHN